MRVFTRRLCLALVTMGMLGVVGCGADNASEGEAASKKLGDPGKADPKGLPSETISAPKTEAERGKQGPGGSVLQQTKKPGGRRLANEARRPDRGCGRRAPIVAAHIHPLFTVVTRSTKADVFHLR